MYVGNAVQASRFLDHAKTLQDPLIKYLYHYKFTAMYLHVTYILP